MQMQTLKVQLLAILLKVLPCRGAMEGKIVGGKYGDIQEFPHAVCLNAFCVPKREAFWVCGSAVLNQRLLLTAAHCVAECKNYHHVTALAGSSNLKQAKVIKMVVKMKVHEHFDQETLIYDIAICMLSGNLPLGRLIQRAIIRNTFPRANTATIAGWGVVDERQTRTIRLKHVTQKLWSARSCARYEDLMPGTFCASSGHIDHYPFAGDSGSGLVTDDLEVIGLVSYRINEKRELTFYSNTTYFLGWITKEASKLVCA